MGDDWNRLRGRGVSDYSGRVNGVRFSLVRRTLGRVDLEERTLTVVRSNINELVDRQKG